MVQGTLGRLLASITVSKGHEQALMLLLVLLLVGTVGGAFAGVLVPLRLSLEAVGALTASSPQDMAGGDVKELLCGSWTLTS